MAVAISRMSRKEKLLLELYKPSPSSLVISKEIDRGAYGVVLDGTLEGRRVAIKKVHHALLDTAVTDEEIDLERLIRGFKKETDISNSIRHPHVVQALGAFYDPKTHEPILVMEKMAKNLRKYLGENKGLKELKQIHICLQIALGVQFLHHLTPPLAHRDLTDKNVLIAYDGTVKIGDFGQSKYKDLKDVYFGTEVPGALLFMAPETAKLSGSDKAHYTESVDIFSLGVLALEIATQSGPTPSLHGFGLLPEVKRRENDLKKMGDGHPLKPLVLQCLENNYKKRPIIAHIVDDLACLFVAESDKENIQLTDELKARNDHISELERENVCLSRRVADKQEEIDLSQMHYGDLKKEHETRVTENEGQLQQRDKLIIDLEGEVSILTKRSIDMEEEWQDLLEEKVDLETTIKNLRVEYDQLVLQLTTMNETNSKDDQDAHDKKESWCSYLASLALFWKSSKTSEPSNNKSPPKKDLSRAKRQNSPVSSSSPAVHRMQGATPRQSRISDTITWKMTPFLQASTGATEFNTFQATKNPENTTPSETQWPIPSNTSGLSQTSTNTRVRNSGSHRVGPLGMFSGCNNQPSAGIQSCTTRDRIKPVKDYSQSRSLSTGGLVRCDKCNGEFKNKVALTQHTLQSPCGCRHDITRRRLFTLTETDPPS